MTKPNPASNTGDSGIALAEAPAAASASVNAAAKVTPAGETPAQQARALLKRLQTQFPAFRDCLPLAIGIDKQLIAELPDISRKVLRIALGIHTNSLRYLRVMEKATHRFDLAGKQADEVTDMHRAHASEILRERFKKDAEQRKAQKAADDAAKAAADAARIHAEKLAQLSEKFSRKK
ncbi:osmoprotectant transporter activator [Oxalobacteraceae bacterium CAVE-383]|nr:osmoprotectant transporter activator [Oxalobacteraceae bacterium CAVE-383]